MALAADRQTGTLDGGVFPCDVAAATEIFNGSIVCRNATGYAEPAALDADFRVSGIAQEYVDNSVGADAAEHVIVRKNCSAWFAASATGDSGAPAITDIDTAVYVFDDETVRTYVAGGVNIRCGIIEEIDAALGVRVHFDGIDGATASAPADFVVGDDLTVGDDAAIGGELAVTGVAGFTGLADFDAGISIAAAQAITGDGALDVVATGAALTLDGTSVICTPTLACTADVTVGTTLDVTGLTTTDGIDVTDYVIQGSTDFVTTGVPSQADMINAFGAAAASVDEMWILHDSPAGVYYQCYSDGVSWYYMTYILGL